MSEVTNVTEIASRFSQLSVRIWSNQNELSRIGRLFRDKWADPITALATKIATKTATADEIADYNNYRGLGKTAKELADLASALWALHNLIDVDPPDPTTMDASKQIADISNLVTHWIDTANQGTGNPLNSDIYNVCLDLSRLGHDVWTSVQQYKSKVEPIISKLGDDEKDEYTGRTGKVWRDCVIALDAYWKPFFGHKTEKGYGYGLALLAF